MSQIIGAYSLFQQLRLNRKKNEHILYYFFFAPVNANEIAGKERKFKRMALGLIAVLHKSRQWKNNPLWQEEQTKQKKGKNFL